MAGTIKFFDEMQNASNVSGQDRMMIGKAESGETQVITFDQAKQYLDITSNEIAPIVGGDSEANATEVPAGPSGQTRRADVAPGWIDFGDGPIEAPATNRWMAYWDGSTWSLVDMGELPDSPTTDYVSEGENELPATSAASWRADKKIDDKVLSIVNESSESSIVTPVSEDAEVFGHAVNATGWGFPMLPHQGVSKIFTRFFIQGNASNEQRVVVREENKNGLVLVDKLFNLSIGEGLQDTEFDISDSVIENPLSKRLWIEVYMNTSSFGVYRISPGHIFTEDAGYPIRQYTTAGDLGETQVITNTGYFDVYYGVETLVSEVSDFTDWAKGRISEIANEGFELPQNVSDAVEFVETYFEESSIPDGEFELYPASQIQGPQGGTYNGMVFNIGQLEPFKDIDFRLYHVAANDPVNELTVNIRENDKDGVVVATKVLTGLNIINSGMTIITVPFDDIINNPNRMVMEIISDGQFGAYRSATGSTNIFNEADGYPPFYINTGGGYVAQSYQDFWFKTTQYRIEAVFKGVVEGGGTEVDIPGKVPNENESESFVVSSVTFGDGYLQSGYVRERIWWKQSVLANAVMPGQFSDGEVLTNRKYFRGSARKISGIGSEFSFNVRGNEVSIIQAIERSNVNASEIEVYIDEVLYDTINNFNPAEIGSESVDFVGDGSEGFFDLGRPFTYGHTITVNGVNQVVTVNVNQNASFSIPSSADCAIIRKIGEKDGSPSVNHYVWFKSAPASGAEISVSFDYGENLFYEKTTIGETASGVTESPFGHGAISFDPLNPAAISTGLDFKQTDSRVVKTYRFLEEKERAVTLRIKGLYPGSTGTPYFIFNFATNRYFRFQNAGIGGHSLANLDKSIQEDYFRGWQRVVQFKPDKLVVETTPNEDWLVRGYRLYNSEVVTLPLLRSIMNFPLRSIQYQSSSGIYNISRWVGEITAITETSVTFDATIESPIEVGDYVRIGKYWANNFDYLEREVSSVDGNTVHFDNPITKDQIIYDSTQDFIGSEVEIRDLSWQVDMMDSVIGKIRNTVNCDVFLLENPMPNLLGRGLWGYPILMDKYANSNNKVYSVDYNSLREWQMSQPMQSVTVNVADAAYNNYIGKSVIYFGDTGNNLIYADVLLNGVSIYGKQAVVENGYGYSVNQTATGSSLNRSATATVFSGQGTTYRRARVVLLDDDLTSGELTVVYPIEKWSNDSCHVNANSSKLYADFLREI